MKTKRKFYTNTFTFYDTDKIKIRNVYEHLLYKQFTSEGLELKSDLRISSVKLCNDFKPVARTLECQKDSFHFQAYYQNSNMFSAFDTKFTVLILVP